MQSEENKNSLETQSKKGSLILIDGTSSAGKTSICNILRPQLNNHIEHVIMDDFINNVFERFKKNEITEPDLLPKCNQQVSIMYNHIKDLVYQGKKVICETTLTCLEDAKSTRQWFKIIKDIPGFLVLGYCPLRALAERVKLRNKKALSENNAENTRLIHVVLNQFGVMFKACDGDDQPRIDILSRQDCEFAFDLLKDEFRGDCEKFENFKLAILKKLNLIDNNKTYICPRLTYDYIINTFRYNPEECAQRIKAFLELKNKPQAIIKNCIYTGIAVE